jgi:hypothetical protein
MFGMAAATSIICTLAGRPFEPDRPLQLTTKQFERQLSRLEEREFERFKTFDGVAVDLDEVRANLPSLLVSPLSSAHLKLMSSEYRRVFWVWSEYAESVTRFLYSFNEEAERKGKLTRFQFVRCDQVTYLVRELWRGFSARAPRVVLPGEACVTRPRLGGSGALIGELLFRVMPRLVFVGGDKGLCRSTVNLVLTRWDSARPAMVDNLILLEREEADAHDANNLEDLRSDRQRQYSNLNAMCAVLHQRCRDLF